MNQDADAVTRAKAAAGSGDLDGAKRLLEEASGAGDGEAMLLLGNLAYRAGEPAAYDWWDRAGAAGLTVGWRHAAVQAGRTEGLAAAVPWWTKLAATQDAEAMYHLGLTAYQSGDQEAGRRWMEQSAELGLGDAMFTLGHWAGQSGDPVANRTWWIKAVRAGHQDAMAELVGEPPAARRDAADLADVREAAAAGNVLRIFRLNGGWNEDQLRSIAEALAAASGIEAVLLIQAALLTRASLPATADPIIAAAVALEPADDDHLARWARALGRAHTAGKPYLVADHVD
ncbi:hypothetical protein [Microlunatus sp. GCM10028923]|uniref:hypothetical protein n=1 Tax=Microlunatus sp. GCM10028923 TaxID=3273400 RepID=UPI00360AB721